MGKGKINPLAIKKYANINGFTNFYYHGREDESNDFTVDSYICNGDPVMLGVKDDHHFVVATGQTTVNGIDTYTINDPGSSTNTDLSGYSYSYSSIRMYSSQVKTPSGLYIYAHSPVELLMTDPSARRAGYNVGTGAVLHEIPESSYSAETIADDIDPTSGLTTEEVKSFEALEPVSGNYTLQIIGTGTGSYTIDILAYDSNGTESSQTITGSATPGVGTVYQIGYSSAAGSQVTKTFINNVYTITATAGSGGSISPGTVVVNSGGSQTFTITPNAGYYIAGVTVDGVSKGAITSYTFTNVTAPHTITATFSNNSFTITATAGSGGSISPSGAVIVNSGGSQTFTITPSAGYSVASVTVDGVSQGPITSYTFSNVTANHTITVKFGKWIVAASWGTMGTGNGQFGSAYGIAIDPSGTYLYIADTENNRVQKFKTDGTYVSQWGSQGNGNGLFRNPVGIAVDPTNSYVYVADSTNSNVQKFTTSGTYVSQWGSQGNGNGQLNSPYGIAVDRSGNVYVTEASGARVQKFTSAGVYITKWGTYGSGNGQFNVPKGIAVDPAGTYVYVDDEWNNRVQKFTATGNYVSQWGQFYDAIGITVDASGYVYVADEAISIRRFTSSGSYYDTLITSDYDPPAGVVVDSTGKAYSLWLAAPVVRKLVYQIQ